MHIPIVIIKGELGTLALVDVPVDDKNPFESGSIA